jgi:dolichol-phosphate mannosyltransferase
MPSVSIIVPTYLEAENLRELIARLEGVRAQSVPDCELIIVDDDSRDGVERIIEELNRPWIRLLVRRGRRGLSGAVIEGMRQATGDILVVMDADLSHPPEMIPSLVERVVNGADFALGSRYVAGGSTDARWSIWRWLNSKTATLLARPFTAARDPMSGFFVLRRATFEQAAPLCPLGYKIGLELLVKCRCRRVEEVPIHFAERTRGRSKLTLRQQWLYLRHVARLLRFRMRRSNDE